MNISLDRRISWRTPVSQQACISRARQPDRGFRELESSTKVLGSPACISRARRQCVLPGYPIAAHKSCEAGCIWLLSSRSRKIISPAQPLGRWTESYGNSSVAFDNAATDMNSFPPSSSQDEASHPTPVNVSHSSCP
jgi:hypothetical protein